MDPLARRVASRWGLKSVLSTTHREIPSWVFDWGQAAFGSLRLAYVGERDDYSITNILDPEKLDTAKDSLNALLPKFQALLKAKYHEHFTAHISQTATRVYYFFSGPSDLESFAISLTVHHGDTLLALGYVPHHLTRPELDYSKRVEFSEKVSDPDLAGLFLMRLTKKLLSRV